MPSHAGTCAYLHPSMAARFDRVKPYSCQNTQGRVAYAKSIDQINTNCSSVTVSTIAKVVHQFPASRYTSGCNAS